MVKSFYDPRVEERGIEKGIERGREIEKFDIVQNMLVDGESKNKIKKYTGVTDTYIERISKVGCSVLQYIFMKDIKVLSRGKKESYRI